ncbi:epoxyqueuosine reductase [Oxobacter pfennigii]|uniref:Epoxyqueuosine reductase n=1 Tax=Oxobacter pfennigii TaxID=36849 RepID=A0A0P8WBI2_9CLOT|nr:tRNA epoxyqueuosine(34) reductase QueG [Oxobacter pfennigii]KPU45287.1 epoxyqueuosine reductase [Oxobacter pfennigii]
MNNKELIITESKRIGIDIIGFSPCFIAYDVEETLRDRESKGYLSGFEEKDMNLRINPKLLMENCQTIISAGISYNIDRDKIEAMSKQKFKATMSVSSWGRDYHKVLGSKLEALAEFINKRLYGETKFFVDTNPLLERHIAKNAGIGFVGKNCSLINKEYGSYIFLGEILTDLYIQPDMPVTGDCGDCELCIKACPSGALLKPYTIDAKKCISYLTQNKEIDYENMKNTGLSLYGCDVCQSVCPKNRNIKMSSHEEFIPKQWNIYPDAVAILDMDNKTFEKTYKLTSGGWRGKKNLQKNAIAVIANSGKREAWDVLVKYLDDERPDIKKAAVYGLKRLMESMEDKNDFQ